MKTYTSKSNAKRAGIKAIVKDRGILEATVKANPDEYFSIEGEKGAFYPHFVGTSQVKTTNDELNQAAQLSKPQATSNQTPGLKIEKERSEQNGITRPSIGGKCRAIWDACDNFHATQGKLPMPKEIKAIAAENGWNENNAVIEMYQWRRFNGFVGRQK